MEEGRPPSGKYTWRIDSFSKITTRKRTSETFTAGGCNWQVYAHLAASADHFSLFLEVADAASLPDGWCRDVHFRFTLVDQYNAEDSTARSSRNTFNATAVSLGYNEFKPLSELHDQGKGFVVNDTVAVKVEITLHQVVPPVELATQATMFDSFFSTFFDDVSATGTISPPEGSALYLQADDLVAEAPMSDDIEKAKHYLKEHVSDLFILDVRDRLSSALSTRAGLSPGTPKAKFDDFFVDYLTFVRDNSDFELQKIARDRALSAMEKNYETHLLYKLSFDNLTKEKEELSRKLREASSKEAKLMSDWESLVNESKEVKSRFTSQVKELAKAKEKKRTAEERVSPPTNAPSSLKERLLQLLCVPI